MHRLIGFRGFGEEIQYLNSRIEQIKSTMNSWFYEDLLSAKISFDAATTTVGATTYGGKFIETADLAMESANLPEEEKVKFVSDVQYYVSNKISTIKEVASLPPGTPTPVLTGGGTVTATNAAVSPWIKIGVIGLVIWAMMS